MHKFVRDRGGFLRWRHYTAKMITGELKEKIRRAGTRREVRDSGEVVVLRVTRYGRNLWDERRGRRRGYCRQARSNGALKRSSLGRNFLAEICPSVDHGINSVLQTVHLLLGTDSFNTSQPGFFF